MSDTLQEREDEMTTIGFCAECQGYTHVPWCSLYESDKEINEQPSVCKHNCVAAACTTCAYERNHAHQPAARGGGESDPWKSVHRIKLKHEKVVEAAKLLLAMNNCNYDRDQMRRSGGFSALQEAVEAIDPHWATINQQRSTSE